MCVQPVKISEKFVRSAQNLRSQLLNAALPPTPSSPSSPHHPRSDITPHTDTLRLPLFDFVGLGLLVNHAALQLTTGAPLAVEEVRAARHVIVGRVVQQRLPRGRRRRSGFTSGESSPKPGCPSRCSAPGLPTTCACGSWPSAGSRPVLRASKQD